MDKLKPEEIKVILEEAEEARQASNFCQLTISWNYGILSDISYNFKKDKDSIKARLLRKI